MMVGVEAAAELSPAVTGAELLMALPAATLQMGQEWKQLLRLLNSLHHPKNVHDARHHGLS